MPRQWRAQMSHHLHRAGPECLRPAHWVSSWRLHEQLMWCRSSGSLAQWSQLSCLLQYNPSTSALHQLTCRVAEHRQSWSWLKSTMTQ